MISKFRPCAWCTAVLFMQCVVFLSPLHAVPSNPVEPDGAVSGRAGLAVAPRLRLTSAGAGEPVGPGGSVNYELRVENTSGDSGVSNLKLLAMFPPGLGIRPGSVRLNGTPHPDPVVSSHGKAFVFAVGTLGPGRTAVVRFTADVPTAAKAGTMVGYVSALCDGGNSNVAKLTVAVYNDTPVTAQAAPKAAAPAPVPLPAPPVPAVSVAAPPAAPQPVVPQAPQKQVATAVEEAVPVSRDDRVTVAAEGSALPSAGEPGKPEPRKADLPGEIPAAPAVPAPVKAAAEPPPPPPAERVVPTAKSDEVLVPAAAEPVIAAAEPSAPVGVSGKPPVSPPPADTVGDGSRKRSGFYAPEAQGLAELVGTNFVALSDIDRQFVRNLADQQLLDKEQGGATNEMNLLESIRAGRRFNRESRAAEARTEQAKAQTGQALGLLLPSLSVRANRGLETSKPSLKQDPNSPTGKTPSETHVRTDYTLSVRQPLFDLPSFMDWRRRQVIEQARGESYRGSDGDAYLSTANAYLSLVSTRLLTDMTREFEAQLNDLLVYVEKRTKAGAASVSDAARVRARSQATRSSRLELESSHAAAGVEFVRLTNLVPDKVRLPDLGELGAGQLPPSLDAAVLQAMQTNPEVASLTTELRAEQVEQVTAKGRFLPRVDAEFSDNLSLHAGGDTSSAGQRDQRYMLVFSWNLFNGGSDYNGYKERVARYRELQYRLDDQRRKVVQSLSANYATLTTTRERIVSGYQELKAIAVAAEAMSKRMLSGNQSLLDLLDVYDRYYQVRTRLVSLHVLEMSTAAQLVRLIQGTPPGDAAKAPSLRSSGIERDTAGPASRTAAIPDVQGGGDREKLAKLKAVALTSPESAFRLVQFSH